MPSPPPLSWGSPWWCWRRSAWRGAPASRRTRPGESRSRSTLPTQKKCLEMKTYFCVYQNFEFVRFVRESIVVVLIIGWLQRGVWRDTIWWNFLEVWNRATWDCPRDRSSKLSSLKWIQPCMTSQREKARTKDTQKIFFFRFWAFLWKLVDVENPMERGMKAFEFIIDCFK